MQARRRGSAASNCIGQGIAHDAIFQEDIMANEEHDSWSDGGVWDGLEAVIQPLFDSPDNTGADQGWYRARVPLEGGLIPAGLCQGLQKGWQRNTLTGIAGPHCPFCLLQKPDVI